MSIAVNLPTSLTANSSGLISTALKWIESGDKVALITLVNIEGNAPYPIGTQMLVNQRGDYRGQITGGCAEVALANQAVVVINSRQNVTQRYGLDSPFFDIQLPCGSGIDVYIDALSTQTEYKKIHLSLSNRIANEKMFETDRGRFTKTYQPNERLIIFGQGPILNSLAQLALATGFEVICAVQKDEDVSGLSKLGIKAHTLNEVDDEFINYCDSFTAFVSLFHEHSYETHIIKKALETDLFYIGALGSRKTHSNRLNALSDEGCSETQLKIIHGPVGIDIHAESPAQIAISVIAQIIATMPKQS